MADKRIRDNILDDTSNVITPEQKIEQPTQYDSILQRLEELESQNKELLKKVAQANWDLSQQVKESKRHYWYEWEKWISARKADELFKYRYNCLLSDWKEKVVISTETIWRPINLLNQNTWKWTNEHNIKVNFQDWTNTKVDILDYINQRFQYEDFVRDEDIKLENWKKQYTFRTEKFWTFTISEQFIN